MPECANGSTNDVMQWDSSGSMANGNPDFHGRDTQICELVNTVLRSEQIEWAINMQICDMIQATPELSALVLRALGGAMRASTCIYCVDSFL